MDFKITLVLDKRRSVSSGKFPVKLNVYNALKHEKKYCSIKKYYFEEEFAELQKNKVSKKFQEDSLYLQSVLNRANEIAKDINPFNFTEFEKRFNNNKFEKNNIIDVYEARILELINNEQIGNAESYQSSLNAIKKFLATKTSNTDVKLNITTIDIQWLKSLQKYWEEKNLSISSIGTYLRPLRAIYNLTVSENNLNYSNSPFGRGKFEIPSSTKVNKALKKSDVAKLFNAIPETVLEAKAKDFWFLSFYSNGMNIKDVALLKNRNIDFDENKLVFIRNKTKVSTKNNLTPITVILQEFALEVIYTYKTDGEDENDFVFDILEKGDSPSRIQRKVGNFIKFINQHLKKLAVRNGITKQISVNWARHTFSTLAINAGGSMEFLKEFLGHSNIKTTHSYVGRLEDDTKKDLLNKMFNFNDSSIS